MRFKHKRNEVKRHIKGEASVPGAGVVFGSPGKRLEVALKAELATVGCVDLDEGCKLVIFCLLFATSTYTWLLGTIGPIATGKGFMQTARSARRETRQAHVPQSEVQQARRDQM